MEEKEKTQKPTKAEREKENELTVNPVAGKETKEQSKNNLTVRQTNSALSKNIEIDNFEDARGILQVMIDSKMLPDRISNVNRAFTIAQMGKEMGLSPMFSFVHIATINGTPAPDATAVGVCLRNNNVSTRVVHNAAYMYADGTVKDTDMYFVQREDKDGKPKFKVTEILNDKNEVIDSERVPDMRKVKAVDRVTKIDFWYFDKILNKVIEDSLSYFWSDVIQAGNADKDTYAKYPKDMMLHKAKSRIGKQLSILTFSTSDELKEINQIPYTQSDFKDEDSYEVLH
jgi:hypothetical protein